MCDDRRERLHRDGTLRRRHFVAVLVEVAVAMLSGNFDVAPLRRNLVAVGLRKDRFLVTSGNFVAASVCRSVPR